MFSPGMVTNTTALNKLLNPCDGSDVWLFAYGSLIYKVDFAFLERRPASISNWARRFWQGSHDHRGTVDAPGRVVTLIPSPGAICGGVAYLVTAKEFEHLDQREQNGYLRLRTQIRFRDQTSVPGQVYIATEDNPAFLGVSSERDIAHQILQAEGASGPNRDYLLHLANALRELGEHDPHVFTLERHVLGLANQTAAQGRNRSRGSTI